MPFKMMQNVEHFLKAAERYGIKEPFLAQDLVRRQNIKLVIDTLHELAALASAKGFPIALKKFAQSDTSKEKESENEESN